MKRLGFLIVIFLVSIWQIISIPASPAPHIHTSSSPSDPEYLWFEAENMRGFTTGKLGEPILNPSYLNLSHDKVPGWGMNGPGVSAEWSQGGESEWNSAAACADETHATIYQDIEVPRAGHYVLWVRYADWANKTENFVARIAQSNRTVAQHEFGVKDVVDPHDEISMYWGWAFAWDSTATTLEKGPARISFEIEKAAQARRHIDCFVLTNDLSYKPSGRQKPDFAAMRYMREWHSARKPLSSLLANNSNAVSASWLRPKIAGRDFLMPWNIAKEFWPLYEKPSAARPLYPFNAEPIDQFIETYKAVRDVPIFQSRLVVPVVYLNDLPVYLKEGNPFLKYLRNTKSPFAVLINYGSAQMSEADGQGTWKLLSGELKDQFLGWVSGESVGYVWDYAPTELEISPKMTRSELLDAHRDFYSKALSRKWREIFHTETGPMWDKLIPAQSTSSTSFSHALAEWGVQMLGMETAAVQPMWGMRIAFTRGAARQFGGAFVYYHAPNFGDSATTFTKSQDFAGPDFFFHSRYGPTMGPSLSWYRKSYYLYYMAGASAIYLEQGQDQFFKPGPGDHPFQLNPLGRITDEFMRFVDQHPDRGIPYTPIGFLLDRAHGFEMTDYPQWPFEVSQINRSDRALRELFGIAYYPGTVVEGEPATADRQAFTAGVFGDIFDVLVTSAGRNPETQTPGLSTNPLSAYRAVVAGGRIEWSRPWLQRIKDYVRAGGTLVLNVAQAQTVPADLLGISLMNATAEAHNARCLTPGDENQNLEGQVFRYERVQLKGARPLVVTLQGDPLVTINRVGKGAVIFFTLPDLLGEDERITPFAAHVLGHLFTDASPVRVTGDVEYLINRSSDGWIVTLLNNKGVLKPQQGLAQVDRSAYAPTTIEVIDQQIVSAQEWINENSLPTTNGSQVTVRVAPGGVMIVELKIK